MSRILGYLAGLVLIGTSVVLASVFYSRPSQGDWLLGYWFLVIVLCIGGVGILAGTIFCAEEKKID